MKVLYYCPEYYCLHGGRTHARGFFSALQNLPLVSECYLLPKATTVAETDSGNFKDAEKFYKKALKYFEEINDVGRIGIMLNNLGEVHRRSGDTQNTGPGLSGPTHEFLHS